MARISAWIGFVTFIILILGAFYLFKIKSDSDDKKSGRDSNGLITYKIIEIQKEWRVFSEDDNTVVENKATGERKTLIGQKGKVGEEIKLKD